MPKLISILHKFRTGKVTLVSDVEKAFLQLLIHPDHQNLTLHLWLKDPLKPPTPDNIVVYKFLRMPFGLIFCPSWLMLTYDKHLQSYRTPNTEMARSRIYIDNLICSFPTPQAASSFAAELNQVFADMSCNLREFLTNSAEVRESIPEEDRTKDTREMIKILGVPYHPENDTLHIAPNKLATKPVVTMVDAAGFLAGSFDPLGFITPVTLGYKLAMQDLWKKKLSWKTTIPQEQLHVWKEFQEESPKLQAVSVRRNQVNYCDAERAELHTFTDASMSAMCQKTFLKLVMPDGEIVIDDLGSKPVF